MGGGDLMKWIRYVSMGLVWNVPLGRFALLLLSYAVCAKRLVKNGTTD